MAKVTGIKPQKRNKNRVSIFINNEFFMGISLYTCKKSKLQVGMEVDEKNLTDILLEEEFEEAKIYLIRYCSDKPEKTVREKLKKRDYHEKTINRLISFAYYCKLIDDEKYALAYANDASKFKKHGRKKIEQFLKSKGISPSIINTALQKVNDTDQVEMAIKKLNTKILEYKRKSKTPYDLKNRCYTFLLRAGFETNVISTAISKVLSHE